MSWSFVVAGIFSVIDVVGVVGCLGGRPGFCFIWFPPPLVVVAICLRVVCMFVVLVRGLGWCGG